MDLLISDDLAGTGAEHFLAVSRDAVARKGLFTVALSGGSTPKNLYELLADPNEPFRDQVPWARSQFFWSDERHVPPDDPDSNYRMANDSMLSRVPVPGANVHRVRSENPNAAEAAEAYEKKLREITGGSTPQLDLILLGLGTDGHTASLFPNSQALHEKDRLVAAPWVEKLQTYRITMTLPLLNNAASVMFLVSGSEKAGIVKEVLQGPQLYPAQAVRPTNGKLLWLLDKEAALEIETRKND